MPEAIDGHAAAELLTARADEARAAIRRPDTSVVSGELELEQARRKAGGLHALSPPSRRSRPVSLPSIHSHAREACPWRAAIRAL